MPSLLDRLLGRDKQEDPKKEAPQRVSEDAARKRREELAAEKEAMRKARERAEESEKARLEKMAEEEKSKLKAKAEAKPTVSGKTYVVKSGDSLSKIAKDALGDAKRWPEIYELNKELIGDNPNIIHPGQKLSLPE